MNAAAQQTADAIAVMDEKNRCVRARLASDDAAIWRSLALLPLRSAEDLVWRVGLRPADVGTFLAKFDALNKIHSGENRSESMWHAGLGDGRIRVLDIFQQTEDKTVERIDALRAEAQSFGGALIIENAPTEIKNRTDSWGTSASSVGLMQRIKKQLDPAGILSPGRF